MSLLRLNRTEGTQNNFFIDRSKFITRAGGME